LWPAVIFGIVGGIWMLKLGINKALWLFGLVQIVTILGFAWLAGFGHFDTITATERWMLAGVIGAEAVGVGLGTAAFVAYMARETNPAFTATQLALFTSLAAVPRTFINATTGYLIEWLGYVPFFWLCFFLAVPGMLLLYWVAPWHGDAAPQAAGKA
jgi:PAT family beta-lactamase induction signal transducer AmpG